MLEFAGLGLFVAEHASHSLLADARASWYKSSANAIIFRSSYGLNFNGEARQKIVRLNSLCCREGFYSGADEFYKHFFCTKCKARNGYGPAVNAALRDQYAFRNENFEELIRACLELLIDPLTAVLEAQRLQVEYLHLQQLWGTDAQV